MTTTTTQDDIATASGTFSFGGDLEVVRLGYGAMRITGPGIWGPPADHDEALRVLRRAVELGINFIDTADSYGPDVSEELIAEALHPYADDLVIATKAGLTRQGPDRWTALGQPAYLRQQCELSLRRLGVDRIDLFQLHRIDPDVPVADQVGELKAAAGRGQDPPHRPLRGLRRRADGGPAGRRRSSSVQNKFSLGDRAVAGAARPLRRRGHRVHPLAPGRRPDVRRRPAAEVAAAHDATPSQVALAWLLSSHPVMVPIPGTSTVAHLEENTAAAALELDRRRVGQASAPG